ncbi:MAG: right-handed parallel beta-helix repeat-containing protein [Chitinispirillaceae bacterium]
MKKTICFITALALSVLVPFSANAEKRVKGIIDRDTRWSAKHSPYIITGDIVVSPRARLVITAGTEIIVEKQTEADSSDSFDRADSTLFSIRVNGAISCVGKRKKPIVFRSRKPGLADFTWRGIILDKAVDQYTEIAYTEISGATTAITVNSCSPLIRNNLLENNNVAIHCVKSGSPRIQNNLVVGNFAAGVRVEHCNPEVSNNIIVFNNNLGLWCDNISRVEFTHNCVFGNSDGDFFDCDPELGILAKENDNGDSTDRYGNIHMDPVFSGSPAETRAKELDVNQPTDKKKVKDPELIQIVHSGKKSTSPGKEVGRSDFEGRYSLSKYSPCLHAGAPSKKFRNADGSRNTMGITGGPK